MKDLKQEIILLAKEYSFGKNSSKDYNLIEEKLREAMTEYSYDDFLKIYEELFLLEQWNNELLDLDHFVSEHPDKSYIQLYFFAKRVAKYTNFNVYGINCTENDTIYYIGNSREDLYKFIFKFNFDNKLDIRYSSKVEDKVTFYFMGNSVIHKDKIIAYSENREDDKSLSIYLYTEDDLLKELVMNS